MNLPKISLVIPVYNVEPYIAECLHSVMKQTYQGPMECLIVNDCGTDKSMDVAERLIAEYLGPIEFRVLHHDENKGLSCARNTGIEAAKGDYIYFLDSDDYISNNCIEALACQTGKGDYDVVFGNSVRFYDDGNNGVVMDEKYIKLDNCALSGDQYVMKFLQGKQLPTCAWNKLCRLEYIKKNGIYFVPNIIYEDSAFVFLMYRYHAKMYFTDVITYYYRIMRKDSIVYQMLADDRKRKDALLRIWMIIRQNCSSQFYNEIEELYLHVYGGWFFDVCRKIKKDFYNEFRVLHQEYPYQPFRIWLKGKQNFRWFVKRLFWALPSKMGYRWLGLGFLARRGYNYTKRLIKKYLIRTT